MSYDLEARQDEAYSAAIPREQVNKIVGTMPDIERNGPGGFVMLRGETLYMEIDAEFFSEEESIDGPDGGVPSEVNCISFHIPYAYIDEKASCGRVAIEIAKQLGWELYDLQTDQLLAKAKKPGKPWWKFW